MTTIEIIDRIQTRKVLIEIAERRYRSGPSAKLDFFTIVPVNRTREVLADGLKAGNRGFIPVFHDGTFYHNGAKIAISEYIGASLGMSDFALFRIKSRGVHGKLIPSDSDRVTRNAEYALIQQTIQAAYLQPYHRASAKNRIDRG